MDFQRNLKAAAALAACLAVVGCAGDGCGGSSTTVLSRNSISKIEPCIVSSGSTLWAYGVFPKPDVVVFSFAGALGTVEPTFASGERAIMTVPAGVTSGNLTASAEGTDSGSFPYTIGSLTTVTEVEPNDAVDGSNATAAGNNRTVTGTLSSAVEADHFSFGCVSGKNFSITVTGTAALTEVFVNGTSVTLAGGVGTFTVGSSTTSVLLGLTGAAGTYTATLRPAP